LAGAGSSSLLSSTTSRSSCCHSSTAQMHVLVPQASHSLHHMQTFTSQSKFW
jgi:hypothetical protein